jgi:hypothetical protein
MKIDICCKIRHYLMQLQDNLPEEYILPARNFEEF